MQTLALLIAPRYRTFHACPLIGGVSGRVESKVKPIALRRRQRNNSGRCLAVKHRCIFSKRRTLLLGCSTERIAGSPPSRLRQPRFYVTRLHLPITRRECQGRPAGPAMQFPTANAAPIGGDGGGGGEASFSSPGQAATAEREFARVPEIGSSAGFLDKRDARSSARTICKDLSRTGHSGKTQL